MARRWSAKPLLGLAVFVAVLAWCTGSYIITTPRKWTAREKVQVCLFNVGGHATTAERSAATESVQVKVKSPSGNEDLISRTIAIPAGKTEACQSVTVPSMPSSSGDLTITGRIGGKVVNHTETINFATSVSRTFIQTDKFLYMPGQKVQFRVLTITGPYLKIYTGVYPAIWIESPSGSRIAQWIQVPNPSGLIHEEFQLIDEPEEGTYKIHVESPVGGSKAVQTFKVEDFVLPRFEVTVEAPPYILGTDREFTYKICATYTYGQPVKGNLSLETEEHGPHRLYIEQDLWISGCKSFTNFTTNNMVRSIGISATVTEEGTGQQAKASTEINVERTAFKFKHIGKEDYVKPNLPFTGTFKVKLPSGAPAANEPVTICRNSHCKNLTTNARGEVDYMYPKHEDFRVEIRSLDHPRIENPSSRYRPIMFASSSTHNVKTYYSPSNSSLIIQSPQVQLRCHAGAMQEFLVPVLYAGVGNSKANFTIQLVSRGQIQYTHTEEFTLTETDLPIDTSLLLTPLPPPSEGIVRGALNLPLTVPLTASPKAKVVVWYTREDGEVVPDSQEIKIRKCLTNPINLSWSKERAEPGEEVHLTVEGTPSSLCSLGVVDKSVELLSGNKESLTLESVFEVAEKAMIGDSENTQIDDTEYCRQKKQNIAKRSIWRPPIQYYTDEVDALKMFEKSGLFVFTDLTVETRPCQEREHYYYDYFDYDVPMFAALPPSGTVNMPPPWPSAMGSPGAMDRPMPAPAGGMIMINNMDSDVIEVEDEYRSSSSSVRTYFPDTWLWQLQLINSTTGNSSQHLTLPHTITEWVGKAVCVHPEQGVGLSKKASITTFTPFFIDLTLPPSVKRGEILPVKISVFNYLQEALPVRVVLSRSDEYEILEDPVSGNANGTRSSCIHSQEKVVHTVRIRPNALGDVNLTVEAFVDELFPEVCGSEYVIHKRDRIIKPIPVELEGFEQEKTWTKYMCTSDVGNEEQYVSWRLETPSNIVPDSARGWVTAVGDLLGPTLDNLGSLVKMPYGCGEQNMVNFAPNIFVMQYLEAAEKTTNDIAEKAIKFMKSGYQRELKYRHKDGSFSAFGPSDESGSTWLTAFVLKSFAQAQPFIRIDTTDIDMSRDWLKNSQMENGCFLSKGKVFHKAMKGGIAGNDSPVPLTAYVLTALLEAGELSVSRPISEAAFCLVSDKSDDPYTLALKSYALALARAPEAATLLTQLRAKAQTTHDGMFWTLPPSNGKSAAASVETASYALLAMATLSPEDYIQDMQKLVKWISTKRNGQGGFVSTQDTVVALQAMAKFEMVVGQSAVDLAVLTSSTGLDHSFRITNTTKLLQQRVDLPSFPTTVTADLTGEGCALVQAVLRYNIPEEDPSTAFTLTATTETAPDDDCVTKRIKACAAYTLPDAKSNMAVIEVNLVSGYIPEKSDLKQVVGYGTGLIKRYEVDGRKVTFYIDEFSAEELCVAFRVLRDVDVENPKPGTVRVYDYYDPDQFVSTSYTFPPPEECVSSTEIAAEIEGMIIEPSRVLPQPPPPPHRRRGRPGTAGPPSPPPLLPPFRRR